MVDELSGTSDILTEKREEQRLQARSDGHQWL
jgi:hypothetical protein